MKRVTATACANIALVKYWGKRDDRNNIPATPSVSLTLAELKTTTVVERIGDDPGLTPDHVELNGKPPSHEGGARIAGFLSLWREQGLIEGSFSVNTENSFPTGSGLASSSSGFAALSMALSEFCEKKPNLTTLSRLARQGSGSAGRSIPGGLAAMPSTNDSAARRLLDVDDIPWGMVVAEVETRPKLVGSTEGMNLSRATSPYYNTWVSTANQHYSEMLQAVKEKDFTRVGTITEADCYAMHACMITTRPPLLYWNEVSMRLLREVIDWRGHGLEAYATADAGPHICFLARRDDLDTLRDRVAAVDGVARAVISLPGPPAQVVEKVE